MVQDKLNIEVARNKAFANRPKKNKNFLGFFYWIFCNQLFLTPSNN
ncbi:MAG: hypothetical protein IJX63_15295 [Lachnospiraceae bacterium]|nr:hypothetical protein [Lachnospiraceae bacterium]